MKKLKQVLKDNAGGVNQFVATAISILVIVMFFIVLTAGMKAYNQYGTLNDFAGQLAITAGDAGRCTGDNLTKRYNELVNATGLAPDAEYSAERYVNTSLHTVQYGDTITVIVTLHTEVSAIGTHIPITLSLIKTAKSQQYWK